MNSARGRIVTRPGTPGPAVLRRSHCAARPGAQKTAFRMFATEPTDMGHPPRDVHIGVLAKVATRGHGASHNRAVTGATVASSPRASLEATPSAASSPYNAVRTEEGV